MNRILVPKITFKNIVADDRRIMLAYSRVFEIARNNIIRQRQLTKDMANEYTEVQHEKPVSNNSGSGYEAKS